MPKCDVLVVDDDDATREGLCELIALAGFSARAEKDRLQALEVIREHDVNVVLLDVLIAGLGGLDVLARCAEEGRRAKIIIMTGLDTAETVLGALARSGVRFFFRSRSNLRD